MSIAEPTVPAVALSPRSITVRGTKFVPNRVLPIQSGATILKGPCGSGKSLYLEAVALGLGCGARGRLRPADDALRAEIDCAGVVVRIAQNVTRTGDLSVGALEDFDIGDLIDPPVKDTAAKNRHGIKALLRMSGVQADPALFYGLAGSQEAFERVCPAATVQTDDLVELAGRVKRAFDAKARVAEDQAEREEGTAAALRNAGDGLDLTAETDQGKLNAVHIAAVNRQATLKAQADAANTARTRAADARLALAAATGSTQTVADFEAAEHAAKHDYAVARDQAYKLKRQSDLAKVEQQAAFDRVAYAEARTAAARNTAKAMSGWQTAIEAAEGVAAPACEEIAVARSDTLAAQAAIERAGVVRNAKAKLAQAAEHTADAAKHRKAAMQLRDVGKGTDDVLSKAVASSRFTIRENGMWATLPDGTAKPFYGAMSDGERTKVAFAEFVERARLGTPDLDTLVVAPFPQRVWQDIAPSDKEALCRMAHALNVCIVSAAVDDGELRVWVWTPETTAV